MLILRILIFLTWYLFVVPILGVLWVLWVLGSFVWFFMFDVGEDLGNGDNIGLYECIFLGKGFG